MIEAIKAIKHHTKQLYNKQGSGKIGFEVKTESLGIANLSKQVYVFITKITKMGENCIVTYVPTV